jgi:hypothetical protein
MHRPNPDAKNLGPAAKPAKPATADSHSSTFSGFSSGTAEFIATREGVQFPPQIRAAAHQMGGAA